MSDVSQPGRFQSPAERAARAMYRLGMGYDIDADDTAREGMLDAARIILKSSGALAFDPVTKVILDDCRRGYFEWVMTPRWRLRQRRRAFDDHLAAVDRLLLHVQDKSYYRRCTDERSLT